MNIPIHRHRPAILLALALLLAALFTACDADQVVQTGSGYQAMRVDSSVWATTDSSQPNTLLGITDGAWYDLVGERMVTTDGVGQARLRGPNCLAIFVYEQSGLTLSGCPQGGGTGTCSTGAMVIKDCDVTVSTMPADVTTSGTWVSVTHLETAQMTLVIVGDGGVRITPAVAIDARPLSRRGAEPSLLEMFRFEVAVRDFGDAVQIERPEGSEPLFFYTASDLRLAELQAQVPLPPARTWLGLEDLPPVSRMLSALDPNWTGWLGQITDRAILDGITLGPLVPTLVTIVDGEPRSNLALSWEIVEDGFGWLFRLDPNRLRADGTPYTAAFVAEFLRQAQNGPELVTGFLGVEAVDDFTIQVLLEAPNPNFLLEIAGVVFPE